VGEAHAIFDSGKGMFDGLALYAHSIGIAIEASLHGDLRWSHALVRSRADPGEMRVERLTQRIGYREQGLEARPAR
jgi:hypothetical protein